MAPKAESTPLVGEEPPAPKSLMEWITENLQTLGSITLLITIAVVKTQITAILFRYSHYPTAYSLWSCVVTCVLLLPYFAIRPSSFAVPTKEMASVLGLIVFFTTFDLCGNNVALANLSPALVTCILATNPFWTIILEGAIHRRFQHWLTFLVVLMVVVGAVTFSVGNIAHLNAIGVGAACVAVLSSATKYTFTHKAFGQFKGQMGALALLFWLDIFMMPIILLLLLVFYPSELPEFGEACFTGNWVTFWSMTGTAALGGVRALTQMLVLKFISATSTSTANVFTQALNIVVSFIVLPAENTVTPMVVLGVGLVILSSAFYAFIKSYKPLLAGVDKACPCGKPPAPAEPGKA